jgi:cold shock CspA family protein
MKMLGRIEYYNPDRAFGFVIDAEEPCIKRFFHLTTIISGTPQTGRLALYEAGTTTKGKVALDLEVLIGGGK